MLDIALALRPFIIDSLLIAFTALSISDSPTLTTHSLDNDMACSTPRTQTQTSELWISYHQTSRKHKQVNAQHIDVGDDVRLFDLEDVMDHAIEHSIVDHKSRSVI